MEKKYFIESSKDKKYTVFYMKKKQKNRKILISDAALKAKKMKNQPWWQMKKN